MKGTAMSSRLAYIAFRTVETVARMLSAPLAWRLGAMLGWLSMWLSPRYRRLVIRNLTIAFGKEKSPEEIKALARRHLMHLGGNFFAGMKLPFLSPAKVRRLIETEGVEKIAAALQSGTGAVYSLLHMGNWEILTQENVITPGRRDGAIFQPLHNEHLNAHILRCRERTGCRLFSRRDGFHGPVAFVRDNNGLGVLSDQRAGEKGVWCPFFGRLASTTTLPVLIGRRAGAPVFPVGVITLAPGRWKAVIGDPLPPVSRDLSVEEATALMNEKLEEIIRLSPADWFWVHNRWRTPRGEILLANAKRGLALAPGGKVEDLQPFEIVIRAPETLSECCHSLPAVRALRRGRPDARITVLTAEKHAAFWRMDPEVDEVLAVPEKGNAAAVLRATGRFYDAGVLFSDSRQAAQELKGVGRLIGYDAGRKRLLTQIIPPRKNPGPVAHRSRDFLRIALHCGANVEDPALHNPLPGGEWTPGGFIALCPGGEHGPAQRWPIDRWAEAAKLVAEKTGMHFAVFGTAAEASTGAQLAALIGANCKDLTGKTTLEQLAQRFRQCRAVVAHDSGPAHFAALLGVPVVTIFGPTEPAQTAPQGPQHTAVRRHVECSPCFLSRCPMDHRCMLELTPERVAEAILKTLNQPVPA
jgi:heptosyltransferase-2